MLVAITLPQWVAAIGEPSAAQKDSRGADAGAQARAAGGSSADTVVAGYIAQPFYYRSDIHLTRPDGTDARFKRLGWDGDALMFPIDGGVRAIRWSGPFGYMVDFLHNKAVARLGKGAHGRKLSRPVIEDVDVEGVIRGQPAPSRMTLTDMFDRLEFTHGQNMLMLTPMVRAGEILPGVRPYLGVGFGAAMPHVEVRFAGDPRGQWTTEYQYTGPALQLVGGLEVRRGRGQFFLEYKFSYAWISAALTGDKSWKNFNLPGDLVRQVSRWWRGKPAEFGHLSTVLGAHQIAVGGGYQVQGPAPAAR